MWLLPRFIRRSVRRQQFHPRATARSGMERAVGEAVAEAQGNERIAGVEGDRECVAGSDVGRG